MKDMVISEAGRPGCYVLEAPLGLIHEAYIAAKSGRATPINGASLEAVILRLEIELLIRANGY